MKKLTFFVFLLLSFTSAKSQFSFGLTGAISPTTTPQVQSLLLNRADPKNEMGFGLSSFEDGPRIGLTSELHMDQFFIRLEGFLYQNTTSYSLHFNNPAASEIGQFTELVDTRLLLDVPVSIGYQLNGFRLLSGFTVSSNLKSKDTTGWMEGFRRGDKNLRLGWHTGVGYAYNRVGIELRYHMNFNNYGNDLFYKAENLSLQNSPGRLLAIVHYTLTGV